MIIKIKAKKGFNVILKDLGIILQSESNNWIEVNKELFENSNDARKFAKIIEVSEIETETVAVVEEKTNNPVNEVIQVNDTSFIVNPKEEEKNVENVFIKEQEIIVNEEKEEVAETVKEAEKSEEVQVEAVVEATETPVEDTSTVTEEVVTVKEVKEKPAATKKPANKKSTK